MNDLPLHRLKRLLLPSLLLALGAISCETTGDPYQDTFFFSAPQAEAILAAKHSDLDRLQAQLQSEQNRLGELRQRLSGLQASRADLQRQHGDLERRIAEAESLARILEGRVRDAQSRGAPQTTVNVLQREIRELDETIVLLERELGSAVATN